MKKPKPLEGHAAAASPPDIAHTIDLDVVRSARALQGRARSFVRHVITPTIAAAAETYPELSVAEILALCGSALTRDLTFEFEDACSTSRARDVRRLADRSGATK